MIFFFNELFLSVFLPQLERLMQLCQLGKIYCIQKLWEETQLVILLIGLH